MCKSKIGWKVVNGCHCIGEFNEEGKRAIVFGYKETIEVCKNSKMIIMDGTFRITPSGFTQLYTIHATVLVQGNFLTREYYPIKFLKLLVFKKLEATRMETLRPLVLSSL